MKYVYKFSEGSKQMKDLLGGKGANLAEMTNLGLPVPTGFTITTEACLTFLAGGSKLDQEMKDQIKAAIKQLETDSGKAFNSQEDPLFVSVRSGSKFSMPGMMDTILNLGLNDQSVETLVKQTGNATFAYNCYQRLLKMFGEIVLSIPRADFDDAQEDLKLARGYQSDQQFTGGDWKELVGAYKDIYLKVAKQPFPQEPVDQLFMATCAVFNSWLNPRAKIYRSLHRLSDDLGTAVNIQEMVFGNTGQASGTGVAFTRNPSTGKNELFGEYLVNAQGEDVVAGLRTPEPISKLAQDMLVVHEQFVDVASRLEVHYREMQDIEFTVENEKLYLLQTRNGKRTAKAAFQIAVDMVNEGLITKEEALTRVDGAMIGQLLHPVFKMADLEQAEFVAKGLPASPGASTGVIYFDAQSAKAAKEKGEDVILLRQETSPEDIEGMITSVAIVTSRGGMTSHAAVVARGMGTCCVVGCEALTINEKAKVATYNGGTLKEGDVISVDGSSGKIYLGTIEKDAVEKQQSLNDLLAWADEIADMEVYANAETSEEIKKALSFGAKGVGLARTEHMFFGEKRVLEMRKLILADSEIDRLAPLAMLKEYQIEDFKEIYRLMKELPVTVRLLDPPLHEFLPQKLADMEELSKELSLPLDVIVTRTKSLHESNPMLGHRGCRLAITYPEIYNMQAEAIVLGALAISEEFSINIVPEIMVPLIGTTKEFELIKAEIIQTIDNLFKKEGKSLQYQIGTMIEIPRACLIADQIAKSADFFSFGTNDLTQMTYGYSRDDIGKFLGEYISKDILPTDPFETLDVEGVGELMTIATRRGRKIKPDLKIGVCGELGGDPASIKHFHEFGLTYVSCSPFRIPIARLAAAQAKLEIEMS